MRATLFGLSDTKSIMPVLRPTPRASPRWPRLAAVLAIGVLSGGLWLALCEAVVGLGG